MLQFRLVVVISLVLFNDFSLKALGMLHLVELTAIDFSIWSINGPPSNTIILAFLWVLDPCPPLYLNYLWVFNPFSIWITIDFQMYLSNVRKIWFFLILLHVFFVRPLIKEIVLTFLNILTFTFTFPFLSMDKVDLHVL